MFNEEMMVCFCGDRGVSKTYHLVKDAEKHRKRGFLVITNFTYAGSHFDCSGISNDLFIRFVFELLAAKKYDVQPFDIDDSFKHNGIYIGIDEAHLALPADLFKKYQNDPAMQDGLQMLSLARKANIFISLTVQEPAKLDINWRRFVSKWIRLRLLVPFQVQVKIKNKRKPNKYNLEQRAVFPVIVKEHHNLQPAFPMWNYQVINVNGQDQPTSMNTLLKKRYGVSGWMDRHPYKLYSSYEMNAIDVLKLPQQFNLLGKFRIPLTMIEREYFGFVKLITRKQRNDRRSVEYKLVDVTTKINEHAKTVQQYASQAKKEGNQVSSSQLEQFITALHQTVDNVKIQMYNDAYDQYIEELEESVQASGRADSATEISPLVSAE